MKGEWKKKGHFEFPFFRSVTPEVKTCFLEGLRLVGGFGESRDLVFSPSRSNLGLVSSRLAGFVRNREIYNLGIVSRPVLLKIEGKSWIFIFSGFKKRKKRKQIKNWDEIGQMLVSGALDDTKKTRKAGADIFAKSWPEQLQNRKKSKFPLGFSMFFLWT